MIKRLGSARVLNTAVVGIVVSAALLGQPALDTLPSFEEADINHDNVINIQEAMAIFNDLNFEDIDNDGVLDKREAEQALPGLVYTRDTHEDAEEPIGLADYIQMARYYLTKRLRPLPSKPDAALDP